MQTGFAWDKTAFTNLFCNASSITTPNLNADGWPDLCITSNNVPTDFSGTPEQFLFFNMQGHFKPVSGSFSANFTHSGNVQEVIWYDLDNNGFPDAIVVGHWMPITIMMNEGNTLKKQALKNTNGWWNCVNVADVDQDGDLDFIAGNWGLNSRFTASSSQPITLYASDFDDNGTIDPVITYYYKDQETAFASFDELTKQMPFLKKKYPSYERYANARFQSLFPSKKIDGAIKKEVNELASCYFENKGNGTFKKHILPLQAQFAPIFDLKTTDLNNDGFPDVLMVGNNYEISTQLGRLDALRDNILINHKDGSFKATTTKTTILGAARSIGSFKMKNETYFIITRNGDTPIVLKKTE